MGAGKTTIGRQLARSLGVGFADTDAEIEARTGADIPWIFDVEGEAGFRDREEAIIAEMTTWEDTVLATGGGAVLRQANRQALVERGFVIYLRTTLEEQLRRTRKDRNRPLLQTLDPEGTLRRLFAERDPLYRAVADLVIDTDSSSPKTVAQRVLASLRAATDS